MYDVVVIGAGPAGSAAAYHGSRAGLRVLVVDRFAFPRPKTCGDALTPRAIAAIGRLGASSLAGVPVGGIRLIHRDTMESTAETFPVWEGNSSGMVLPRETLDEILLSRAREAGARFEVGTAVRLIREGSRVTEVVIERSTDTLRVPARCVVLAIGSVNTRFFQRKTQRQFPAVGLAGRVDLRGTSKIGDYLDFYFPLRHEHHVLSAYGWLFPAGGGRASVGVGVVRTVSSGRVPLRELVDEFVAWLVATDPRCSHAERCSPMRAASITGFPLVDPEPGVVAVGDAAGIANPFTGEGIAPALESGELAARAISRSPENAHQHYDELLRAHFPQVYRLRPALAPIHSRPWIVLGRGWDLMLRPKSRIGRALKRFLWDVPTEQTSLALITHRPVQDVLAAIRIDLKHALRRLPPLTAELVHALIADPENEVGWCTAFAAMVRIGLVPGEEPLLTSDMRRVLVALELIGIVGTALGDLPDRPRFEARSWGRKTLALLVADSLSVEVLTIASGLSQPWRGFLTTFARQTFRHAASEQCQENTPKKFPLLEKLLQTAGLVGIPIDARTHLDTVATVATSIAALRTPSISTDQFDLNTFAAIRRASAPLRTRLEEALSIASVSRKDIRQKRCEPIRLALPGPARLPRLNA